MTSTIPADYPDAGPFGSTDPLLWRLDSSDSGRHVWHYLGEEGGRSVLNGPSPFDKGKGRAQNTEEKHWLGLKTDAPELPDPAGDPLKCARNGYEYYKLMQSPDGHWSGEYGGPMFLIPGLVIACYVTQTPLPQEWKIEMARYLKHMQRNNGVADNGWGLHIEGPSTVFGTSLNYVALRLMGLSAEESMMVRARETLHFHGGAVASPSWGSMWLAVLNVYSWEGMNPTPPELLLLPEWVPFHPWRYWIHMRQIYIPLAFLWATKFQAPTDDLIISLRKELYTQPYSSINWKAQRNNCAPIDLYTPHPPILDLLFSFLDKYNYVAPSFLRQKGIDAAYAQMVYDDENTSYQALAPVNKPLNFICRWIVDGEGSESVKLHREKFRDFMWLGREGMMMCGTNGSQLWDCVFITQAVVESGLAEEEANKASVIKALEWLDDCQIKQNPKWHKEGYRHDTKGAWPFSTREQGYTVSDCTAEGLKSVLMLQDLSYTPKLIPEERLQQAVDILLSLQNPGGGFASYELIRGTKYLELLNPAEVFGNIMIEYNYPECTTAALTALSLFTKTYPSYRRDEIQRARQGAVKYIHASQRSDGSWFGSWGICFTYATMFALESLASFGETCETSERARRACHFLESHQREDGGWGESFQACEQGVWVENEKTLLINTAWACLGMMTAKSPNKEAVKRGIRLIMSRQQKDGHWEREGIEGIFNKSCAISYPNFLFSWTIYALGKFSKLYPDERF